MKTRKNINHGERPPFPARNGITRQYRIIGSELLRYEEANRPAYAPTAAGREFREGVAFMPVEVLESYLDDLLDLEISEEQLFINRKRLHVAMEYLIVVGLLATIGVGLYMASQGASLTHSFGVTALLTLPFILLWYVFPRGRLARRLSFAQLLSQEVLRRRGADKDGTAQAGSGLFFGDIFGPKAPGSPRMVLRTRFYH